jgi:large conductance mechanosensitive channel
MSILKEFRQFAVRGNVVDLALAVIIGAAFGKIVSSFVGDIVMPPLGLLIGGVNFTDLALTLKAASGSAPAVVWAYGRFLQTVFDFTLIAFVIFVAVRGINRLKREEEAAPAAPPRQEVLLEEIRDLLRQK